MIKIAENTIVTIDKIRDSTYDACLDTEYREALSDALITLGYMEDPTLVNPIKISIGESREYTLINKLPIDDTVITKELNGNEISEIIHLMMYKMRNDFQYGKFKPVAMKYLDISKNMLESGTKQNESYINEKLKCNVHDAYGDIFEIIGKASKTLKSNNMFDKSREMIERATMSYSYEDALNIINEYVDTYEKAKENEEEEEFE